MHTAHARISRVSTCSRLPGAQDYWLSDGLYGSFNCVIYDAAKPQPQPLRNPRLPPVAPAEDGLACSTLFGPTCDGAGGGLHCALPCSSAGEASGAARLICSGGSCISLLGCHLVPAAHCHQTAAAHHHQCPH